MLRSASALPAIAAALALLTSTAACRRPAGAGERAGDAAPGEHGGIAWFAGSVEEAFALAKAERKPLFLYWGAVWCPPCQILRVKLFGRPEFQARLAAAVPVYLDGDTERAQIWGEKLSTAGYPTVIVFDADGREVTRLNSLVSLDQYTRALDAAFQATRSVPEAVAALRAGGVAALTPADLNLLAFYSWYQDTAVELDLAGRRDVFGRLWRETPESLPFERSRFLALYAEAAADSDDELEPAVLPAPERERLERELVALLGDAELRAASYDLVAYGASIAGWLAPRTGPERDRLVAAWSEAVRALEADERLTAGERVGVLGASIELERLDVPEGAEPPPLSPAVADHLRERVRWALATVEDQEELQGVMNTVGGLLEDAGLLGEVRTLLAENRARAVAPYYYTGWLASLEEEAGHPDEAVRLYREAWQGARAAASGAGMTPLRWGSNYLRKATKLTPGATEAIAADARQILGEALATPDAFAGGNWSRLEALSIALDEWASADSTRGAIVLALDDQIRTACASLASDGSESPGARCTSLVEPKPAA
jgi:hypothetical protein